MSTFAIENEQSRRPTREDGLAIASERQAARRRRTSRIRKWVAVLSVAAFIGPFGVIYMQLAAGKDPALATNQAVATKRTATTSSGSTTSGSTAATSPAPVTTQQS